MLTRKMLRDVIRDKTSFLAVFLLLFLGCYIFSGIGSEYYGMQVSLDTYEEAYRMADARVQAESFPTHYGKDIETQPIMSLSASYGLAQLDIFIIKENHISKLYIAEGEPFSSDVDGVWLDERFAKAHHLQVEDTMTFSIQGKSITKTIRALVFTPAAIYQVQDNAMTANHARYGFLYMADTYAPFPFTPNQVLIKSNRPDLKHALVQAFDGKKAVITMKEDDPNHRMLQDEIHQHKELGTIFSLTFLGIAVLVSITTMHRLLRQQTSIIAILKALGFSNRRLYMHYASHCTFLSFCGAILGVILGQISFSAITYPFMNAIYTLPKLTSRQLPITYALPVLCALSFFVIALFITHRHLRVPAAVLLHHRGICHVPAIHLPRILQHTSCISQWNIKDITRNPLRSVMSIFGVVGCTALLIGAFGMYTTMNHLSTWTFQTLQTYECKVDGSFSAEKRKELITAMNGDELMQTIIDIKADGKQEQIPLSVLSALRYQHLARDSQHFLHLHEGVAVSKTIAEHYHLQPGDTLTWKPYGTMKWQNNRIEGIIRTPMVQGVTIMKTQLQQQQLSFQATSIIGHTPPKEVLHDASITAVQYQSDMMSNLAVMMDATLTMIAVFVIAAILLGSVILYNLGSLSYMERYHELATLKVLGFQSKALRKIMLQQNIWLTLVGIGLGILGGHWLLTFMLGTVQDSLDVMPYLPFPIVILACTGTLLLSILIIIIVSRKVTSLDMVSALKSED